MAGKTRIAVIRQFGVESLQQYVRSELNVRKLPLRTDELAQAQAEQSDDDMAPAAGGMPARDSAAAERRLRCRRSSIT